MNYQQILEKIYNSFPMYHRIGVGAYKEGLENIEALTELLHHPEKEITCIHIAGTNGKGSVAHLAASYCQELGLKTGLFTSPHLVDFRERIRIDGELISEEYIVQFFNTYQAGLLQIEPSFFEVTTILALNYFAIQKVDVAIIEVGLGGRLDATNIVHPFCCAITNIALEHTQLLGDTLEKIAFEKSGIMKHGVPVVIGEYDEHTLPVFQSMAVSKGALLTLGEKRYAIEVGAQSAETMEISVIEDGKKRYFGIQSPLCGQYEIKNITTFLYLTDFIRNHFNKMCNPIQEAIEHLVVNTHLMGRWQVIQRVPLTICDVGHNPAGISQTMSQIRTVPHKQMHFLMGFVNDKDLDSIMALLPREGVYYLCRANISRAVEPHILKEKFEQYGLRAIEGSDVVSTYHLLSYNVDNDDVVYIGGSCFVVGDFLKWHLKK